MRQSAVLEDLPVLLAALCALALLAGDVRADQSAVGYGAPVEERELPPLITPPGALADPVDGEVAAPDPLVSDIPVEDATPAAARVGDAGFRAPTFRQRASTPAVVDRDVPADAAGVLFGQLQDLQQEIMSLRGLVEAQQNRIDRLEREQRERYLDLDRRLARGGAASGGGGVAGASGSGPIDDMLGADAASADAEPVDERTAYERAFALTREKRFEEAIPAFRRVIESWPDGQYVANAWYWLGELHLALPEPDLEQARQSFVQVIRNWPDNRKVPDARYKLGVVYDRLGEPEQARELLSAVVAEHPDSPAARLAASYLDQLGG